MAINMHDGQCAGSVSRLALRFFKKVAFNTKARAMELYSAPGVFERIEWLPSSSITSLELRRLARPVSTHRVVL